MADTKAILKDVLRLWRRWNWTDYDDASLAASRIISENRLTAKSLSDLPDTFFTFNRVSRAKVLQALRQIKPPAAVNATNLPVRILLLTASPEFTAGPFKVDKVRVDKEHKNILKTIRASTNRDSLSLHVLPAAEPEELIDELNRIKPTILQISAHGEIDGILLEGDSLYTAVLSAGQLSGILATASPYLKIVMLNSCHSYKQAQALVQHVDIAIGMSQAIGDDAARVFSGHIYSALAEGVSVQMAFEQALIKLDMQKSTYTDVPRLYHAKRINPRTYTIC